MKKLLFLTTLVLLIFFISGCHSSRYVVRERPMEPHYAMPMSPGPNYIWHNGLGMERKRLCLPERLLDNSPVRPQALYFRPLAKKERGMDMDTGALALLKLVFI